MPVTPSPPTNPAPSAQPLQPTPAIQQPVQESAPQQTAVYQPQPQAQPTQYPTQPAPQPAVAPVAPQQNQPLPVAQQASYSQPQATPNPQYPQQPNMPMQPQQFPQQPLTASDIQSGMRKKILTIIGGLTTLSVAAVVLLFLVSGAGDSSLAQTTDVTNSEATYSIPSDWSVDNKESFDAYYNQATLQDSQATLLVLKPVRISFDSERVSDAQMLTIAEDYRRAVNEGEGGLVLADGVTVEVAGFYLAQDYVVTGLADDGVTEIRGISRLLFDDNNYAHTLEFVAIRSYWEANQSEILDLINSYTLKGLE